MRQDELGVRTKNSNLYWKYGLPTLAIVIAVVLGFIYFSQIIAWTLAGLVIFAGVVYAVRTIPPAVFNSLIMWEKWQQERIATNKADISQYIHETKAGVLIVRDGKRTIEIDSFYPIVSASKELADIPQLPATTHVDLMELIDAYPHTLVWGGSGNGKTSLLRTIAHRRKLQGHNVLVLDTREHPAKWQGLERMDTPAKVDKAIAVLFQILNKNVEALRTGQATEADFEKISVVTDEWTEIVAENDTAKEFIATMVRQSRKYGIHLIFATQTNLAADLGLDGRYKTINGFLQLELKKRPDGAHIANAVVANEKLGEVIVPAPPPTPELLPTADYIAPALDDALAADDDEMPNEFEQQVLELYDLGESISAIAATVYGNKGGSQSRKIKAILEKFGRGL
jgi:hypothetical protein